MPIKRKSRKKKIDGVDLLVPVDIYSLGSKDDPCFGKHYSPRAKECRQCGDCEVCSIVMAQKLHKTRDKVEAQGKFRDMEERKIYETSPMKKLRRLILKVAESEGPIHEDKIFQRAKAGLGVNSVQFNKALTTLKNRETPQIKVIKNMVSWIK